MSEGMRRLTVQHEEAAIPTTPPTRCNEHGCGDLSTKRGRCDNHQPTPWAGRDDKAARYGITSGTWRKLKRRTAARDHGCCYACGADQHDADPNDEPYVLDHKIPITEGGSVTDPDNLGLLCPACDDVKSKAEAARGNTRRREAAAGR